jgi:hypothetical protein
MQAWQAYVVWWQMLLGTVQHSGLAQSLSMRDLLGNSRF